MHITCSLRCLLCTSSHLPIFRCPLSRLAAALRGAVAAHPNQAVQGLLGALQQLAPGQPGRAPSR